MRIERLRVGDELLGPLRREQIDLFEKVEKLVLRPFRIGEALVLGIGLHGGRSLLARHPLHGSAPEVEIGAAEPSLQFDRASGIRQPIFDDMAERLDRVLDLFGEIDGRRAFFARLQIGGERLAALFDQAREIMREALDIDVPGCRYDRLVRHLVHGPLKVPPARQCASSSCKVTAKRQRLKKPAFGRRWH